MVTDSPRQEHPIVGLDDAREESLPDMPTMHADHDDVDEPDVGHHEETETKGNGSLPASASISEAADPPLRRGARNRRPPPHLVNLYDTELAGTSVEASAVHYPISNQVSYH
ncbi:unnamed protein product [Linum trigynum]|uniref:Uncharacterized protein n=1 Tax=Linum trigynum TaxID=586398 RepID=A0AAV2EA79_9ROSI